MAKSKTEQLDAKETAALVKFYQEQPLGVDKLPYSFQFDEMVEKFHLHLNDTTRTKHTLYNTLIGLRKSGRLARKSRTDEQIVRRKKVVEASLGLSDN